MDNPYALYDKRLLNLESCAFLNTYKRIDLDEVIQNLGKGVDVTTDPSRWGSESSDVKEIHKLWQDANFNPESIKWTNYYPGYDFSQDLVNDVAFYLRMNGVHRAWISKVDPGFYAPWHWDADEKEQEYLDKGEVRRYSIFIGHKGLGHVFMLGKDYLYNLPKGSIFRWKDYKEWHAGMNAGLTPKYMFHIIGY